MDSKFAADTSFPYTNTLKISSLRNTVAQTACIHCTLVSLSVCLQLYTHTNA